MTIKYGVRQFHIVCQIENQCGGGYCLSLMDDEVIGEKN